MQWEINLITLTTYPKNEQRRFYTDKIYSIEPINEELTSLFMTNGDIIKVKGNYNSILDELLGH